ncbi:MAG: response regulator transcription factor [Syntrophobacteraceae bacterium]
MQPTAIICDDESHIRSMLKLTLKSMGVEVVGEARTAGEAEILFQRENPHLVLLDINMPGRSGEDALGNIVRDFPSAFVIMLTSVSDMETVRRCLEKGAANYILKDTPIAGIKEIIKETWVEFMKKRETGDV